jgi:hypothetical protein
VNELLDQSEDSGSLEIDFVAHSGGAHIALNTTPFMPAEFKVDDLVTMGGLFKAYEWKETGRLDSVGHFYDILSDRDTTVLPVRNGLILGFNYTAWHRGSCDWGCIWRQFGMGWSGQTAQCCTPGLGDLPNTERIRAGTSHSSYWSNAGVNAHLQQILCENKR